MISHQNSFSEERSQPREHHYMLAHHIIRDVCEQDPMQFFSMIGSPQQSMFATWLWEVTVEQVGRPMEDIDPSGLSFVKSRVQGFPVVLIEMPPPKAVAEAHYVAVVLGSESEVSKGNKSFRYFTLERGKDSNGAVTTTLCEWTDSGHKNYGSCPCANVKAFIQAIEPIL